MIAEIWLGNGKIIKIICHPSDSTVPLFNFSCAKFDCLQIGDMVMDRHMNRHSSFLYPFIMKIVGDKNNQRTYPFSVVQHVSIGRPVTHIKHVNAT